MSSSTRLQSATIRSVALFEAFKGIVVLAAASGLLLLAHKDLHALAAGFIAHMHLNPASHYPQIFLEASARLHDGRLLALAIGAAAYALLRFVEAYGLYFEKAWAEVLAALSAAIYVPVELAELLVHPGWQGGLLLLFNLFIVALMAGALLRRRRLRPPYRHTPQP